MEQKGFTIIELIISIFILSVAVVGIFSAFSMMNILTSDAADRLVATYLSQEGMEIIRNIRDTNWLNMDAGVSGVEWASGINCTQGCEADYTTTGSGSKYVIPYSGAGDYLNINTDGFYGYAPGVTTKFKRKITVTSVADGNNKSDYIIKVVTQVSWDEKATILNSGNLAAVCGASNCITAEGVLYDWYNYNN